MNSLQIRRSRAQLAGSISAAALLSGSGVERAEGGFTDPAIPDSVYKENAKQHLGPIRWEKQPDGSWFQRGGCVYVKIFYTDPVTKEAVETIASGVIINEWTVVTAAHVADLGMESGGPPPAPRTLCIGWTPNCFVAPVGQTTPDEVMVKECHFHPDYFTKGPANSPDCAVLITEKPIVDPVTQTRSGAAFFPTQPSITDETLVLCGYGKTNNNLDTGDARAGNARYSIKTPLLGYSVDLYESSNSIVAPDPRLSGNYYDSGGPVKGQGSVIGLGGVTEVRTLTKGHMVTASLSGLGFTDYLDYRGPATQAFIEQHIKVDLPQPEMTKANGAIILSWPQTPYNVGVSASQDLKTWEPVFAPVSVDAATGVTKMAVGSTGSPPRRFFRLYNRLK